MLFHNTPISFGISRNFYYTLLAFFCLCGSVVGAVASHYADPFFLSLMRMAARRPVSIVDLPTMILVPFLISAAISFFEKPFLLLPLSFFKSLTYTLALSSARLVFGSAGWLVSCVLLFSDSVCTISLFCYCIRHISGFQKTAATDLFFAFCISISAGFADSYLVSPYLAAIINS